MENYSFFSVLSRMKYINRWGLMRCSCRETLSEHSLDVAVIAHALAVIKNTRFSGELNCDRIAVMAMFHDVSEILTGDLPTPVKYYNEEITSAYKQVERSAKGKLLSLLPEDLAPEYEPLINGGGDAGAKEIIKAADKISALLKCAEEASMGNREFSVAERTLRAAIDGMEMPEVDVFMQEFFGSFMLTLDEM